jgi:hypothetical protein
MKRERRQQGEREVRARPRRRHQDHVTARMPQRPVIHRHRLSIAKQEGRVQQQQQSGQQQCAKWIDVLERVETHATEAPGSLVTAQKRDQPVRGLMEGDGDDDRDHPGRGHEERHGASRLSREGRINS